MKNIAMINQKRWVFLRGYMYEVTCTGTITKDGEYIVKCNDRIERVPEHLFFHEEGCAILLLRDSVEFRRKYKNHPIEVIKLPIL